LQIRVVGGWGSRSRRPVVRTRCDSAAVRCRDDRSATVRRDLDAARAWRFAGFGCRRVSSAYAIRASVRSARGQNIVFSFIERHAGATGRGVPLPFAA
ncbi:hypothetical protein, partial [Burkholderia sp. SCN-KJ]|uniref:hypothetical protein n=1 Tax=Burkholderia sp. SCN-KJ TaxID=2969248 RepID=UPI00214F8F85